jgi:hypothetical protein
MADGWLRRIGVETDIALWDLSKLSGQTWRP